MNVALKPGTEICVERTLTKPIIINSAMDWRKQMTPVLSTAGLSNNIRSQGVRVCVRDSTRQSPAGYDQKNSSPGQSGETMWRNDLNPIDVTTRVCVFLRPGNA